MDKLFQDKHLSTTEVHLSARCSVNQIWKPPCIKVTPRSPARHRRAMVLMAENIRIETNAFAVTPYSMNEDTNCVGYLIYDQMLNTDERHYFQVVGGACFRNRFYPEQFHSVWALQWAWLFPTYRGGGIYSRDFLGTRGIFDEAWKVFEVEFPNFFVETPCSKAMSRFLEKSPDRLLHLDIRGL